MTINGKTLQAVVAYASIVFAVLTQALSGIHLPGVASAVLGAFGVLLHPQTSVNATAESVLPTKSRVSARNPVGRRDPSCGWITGTLLTCGVHPGP